MAVQFTYYGGMTVLIQRSDGFRILCDPYLNGNISAPITAEELPPVDLILVTHASFDHYGDTGLLMRKSNATLMAGADVLRLAQAEGAPSARLVQTIYGDERHFGQTTVHTAVAFHTSGTVQSGIETVSFPFGYVVEVEPGVTYYHSGDTALYSDMKLIREQYAPQIMCVQIAALCEPYPVAMPARDAAIATRWVGAHAVIPTHYPPGSPALQEFQDCLHIIAPKAVCCSAIGKPFLYYPAQLEYFTKVNGGK